MKKKFHSFLGLFMLSSCLTQQPAPIEFCASQNKTSGYSERTSSSLPGSEGITRREMEVKKVSSQNEAFVEYKEVNPAEEEVKGNSRVAIEKRVEKQTVVEEKRSQSLEEEMDEEEAKHEVDASVSRKEEEEIVRPEKVVFSNDKAPAAAVFAMPVNGKITTKFGEDRAGKKSNGIDISAKRGAEIKSVSEGKVVYAGQDPKFGNLIIIKIGSTDLFAAYAHMDDLLYQKDDEITKNQVIGHVGATGDTHEPLLHFAIRKGKTPVDPLGYLSGAK